MTSKKHKLQQMCKNGNSCGATTIFVLSILLCVTICFPVPIRAQGKFTVITWGDNSPDWDRDLHVTGIRFGCSDAAASCVKEASRLASTQNVSQIYLATILNPSRIVSDAETYSNASLSNKSLYEVGFDDFVSQSQKTKLNASGLSSLLVNVNHQLKSQNPNLKLGITLYEDQLAGELPKLGLSDDARRSVDLVHLFPHYRNQDTPFQSYIDRVQQLFPNAKVIAGSYAYDRREYLPCSRGSSNRCSDDDEIKMFTKTLQEELSLANSGRIVGIEFFPGAFGKEETWKGWDNSRFCRAEERQECVQNTKAMRQVAKDMLSHSGN